MIIGKNSQKAIVRPHQDYLSCLEKQIRWKPSELELAVLEMHFNKTSFPSMNEKEQILKRFNETFGQNITHEQLNKWIKDQKDNSFKIIEDEERVNKKAYLKFEIQDVQILLKKFEQNNYPSVQEMKDTAEDLGVGLSKVENWYKHHRRSLAKKGQFDIKSKKYFKKSELDFLQGMFDRDSKPTKEEILQIATQVNCSEIQIRNWFSNKRKKVRSLSSKDLSSSNSDSPIQKVFEIPALQMEDDENSNIKNNDQIQFLQLENKKIEHLLRYQILKNQNSISQCYNSPFNYFPKADALNQSYLNFESNLQILQAQALFGQNGFLRHPNLIHTATSTQIQNLERLRNGNLQMPVGLNRNIQNLIYLNQMK